MALSPVYGINGYVKVPMQHRNLNWPEILEVHGGITYQDESTGWIGFDTSHAFDIWPLDEILPLNPTDEQRMITNDFAKIFGKMAHHRQWVKVWSIGEVEEETNHLATQVLAAIGAMA